MSKLKYNENSKNIGYPHEKNKNKSYPPVKSIKKVILQKNQEKKDILFKFLLKELSKKYIRILIISKMKYLLKNQLKLIIKQI